MAKRRRRRRVNLGEVTKKDFVSIAKIFCQHRAPAGMVEDVADYFKSQNPRFNTDRFLAATKRC
jgi:hypothetical protein